jgi:hypothetical protein
MLISLVKGRHPLSIHVVWLIILAAVLALSRLFRPSVCVFHSLTGLPCLSCGLTRAADAFLRGDFLSMLYFNPLAVLFCASLATYSFWKFVEYIFDFQIVLNPSPGIARAARLSVLMGIAANWLFLIIVGR